MPVTLVARATKRASLDPQRRPLVGTWPLDEGRRQLLACAHAYIAIATDRVIDRDPLEPSDQLLRVRLGHAPRVLLRGVSCAVADLAKLAQRWA